MMRIKSHHLALMIGLIAPLPTYAANFCIKVNGGFGGGGTTYVGKGYALPAAGLCKAWAGYAKTSNSAIVNTTGSGCTSTDGKVFTLTLIGTDPAYLGTGGVSYDHIRICPGGSTGCPTGVGIGTDVGTFGGPASKTSCTTALLNLPAVHD
jgi:hypothetical protein